jgi:RNA polymerase sigma factor (TIGR02999 family)
MAPQADVTQLLLDWRDGDDSAADRLMSLLYGELKEIAHRHLSREAVGHTVNTTALVHEAYVGLADQTRLEWQNRAHFLAASSRVMRHILIDYARRRGAAKRGGDRIRVPLHDAVATVEAPGVDLLDLERALTSLAERDERMARVVECRYFGGMTEEESAEALGVSARTVGRLWTRARVYLLKELQDDAGSQGGDR